MKQIYLFAGAMIAVMAVAPAQAQSCNAPAPDVVTMISLPGAPVSAIPTRDGCTIFVALNAAQYPSSPGHIAILGRAAGKIALIRDVPVSTQFGVGAMALSHDGRTLAVANISGVLLLDTGRLLAGGGKPIIEAKDEGATPQALATSVNAAISPDDRLVFVSDENTTWLTVYDLAKLRGGSTDAIGRVPVGYSPVGLVFSPDGRKLYATTEVGPPGEAPEDCHLQYDRGDERQGLLTVVDVVRAASDPSGAVLAKVPGGCDPVRVALSGDGGRAFVTARGADSLTIFDTGKLVSDSSHALVASVRAGKAPVGVAAAGRYVVTSDSNRFAPLGRKSEWLSVIDPAAAKVIGNVPAGLFPRDMAVTADGKTLLVINSNSNSLEVVALEKLTPAYFASVKPAKDADDVEQAGVQAALEARIQSHQPAPGTEAVLRHILESFARGAPDYDAIGPDRARSLRAQRDRYAESFQAFGALQSIAFQSTNRNGVDEFDVTFEHAKTQWGIALSPDGKAALLGLDSVK